MLRVKAAHVEEGRVLVVEVDHTPEKGRKPETDMIRGLVSPAEYPVRHGQQAHERVRLEEACHLDRSQKGTQDLR